MPKAKARIWPESGTVCGFGVGEADQFKNNYFTEMCRGSEAGSYLRLIDFVYHSTLGLRVIKKRRRGEFMCF